MKVLVILQYIIPLCAVEREARNLHTDERWKIQQALYRYVTVATCKWMQLQRQKITDG